MPPSHKLLAAQIDALTAWVTAGAAWPAAGVRGRGSGTGSGEAHLAFQAVRRPVVPRVKNQAWVKTPVDAFVLAELERQGLEPAPRADARKLIRRASYDLIGLPPTADEAEAFIREVEAEKLIHHEDARALGEKKGDKGEPVSQGPMGLKGDMGVPGLNGESALTDGPGAGGVLTEFARVGSPAPRGETFSGDTTDLAVAANRREHAAFIARTKSTSGDLHYGLYLATDAGLICVARPGDIMPDGFVISALTVTSNLISTSSGAVYLLTGPSAECHYGWDNGTLFTVIPNGAVTPDGKYVGVKSHLQLLSPNTLIFQAALYPDEALTAPGLGWTRFAYRRP